MTVDAKQISWAVHFGAYYLTWLGGIYLAALGFQYLSALLMLSVLLVQLVWQFVFGLSWKSALSYALCLAMLGALSDTLWLWLNMIYFNANPFGSYFAPLWMMVLWLSFGFNLITLYNAHLTRYYSIGFLTLAALPLAYWLGIELGAAHVLVPGYGFYLLLGLTWALMLPVSLYFFQRLKDH